MQDAGKQVQVSLRQLCGSFPDTISSLKKVQREPRDPLQNVRVGYKGRFREMGLGCVAEFGCGEQFSNSSGVQGLLLQGLCCGPVQEAATVTRV